MCHEEIHHVCFSDIKTSSITQTSYYLGKSQANTYLFNKLMAFSRSSVLFVIVIFASVASQFLSLPVTKPKPRYIYISQVWDPEITAIAQFGVEKLAQRYPDQGISLRHVVSAYYRIHKGYNYKLKVKVRGWHNKTKTYKMVVCVTLTGAKKLTYLKEYRDRPVKHQT